MSGPDLRALFPEPPKPSQVPLREVLGPGSWQVMLANFLCEVAAQLGQGQCPHCVGKVVVAAGAALLAQAAQDERQLARWLDEACLTLRATATHRFLQRDPAGEAPPPPTGDRPSEPPPCGRPAGPAP